jgi:hypothetical protein
LEVNNHFDSSIIIRAWARAGLSGTVRFWKSAEGGTGGFLTSILPRPAPYMRDTPEEYPADVQAGVWREVEQALSLSGERLKSGFARKGKPALVPAIFLPLPKY